MYKAITQYCTRVFERTLLKTQEGSKVRLVPKFLETINAMKKNIWELLVDHKNVEFHKGDDAQIDLGILQSSMILKFARIHIKI